MSPAGSPEAVLSVGELLWDLLPTGPVLGGAPANLAYRIACLGGHSRLVSRVGRDDLGERARRELRALGLDDTLLQTDPRHPTGTVRVTFNDAGGHDFEIPKSVAYDFIEPHPDVLAAAAVAPAICFGTLIQRSPSGRAALEAILEVASAAWIVCDVNLRRDCYSVDSLLWSTARANVLKLNDDEITDIARMLPNVPSAAAEFVRFAVDAWNLRACVVTLGERGALAAAPERALAYDPGFRVDVVDTIGSGDAFTAAFLGALMDSAPLPVALRRANAVGAIVACQEGATRPVTTEAIEALLGSPPPRVVDSRFADAIV